MRTTAQIKADAKNIAQSLEEAKRDNGDTFLRVTDGSPEWITDAIRVCHDLGEILPDDWRYQFVYRSAVALANSLDERDADPGATEVIYELESDFETWELTRWLHSSNRRVAYLDEAIEDGAKTGDDALSMAQLAELREVGHALVGFLLTREE